MSVQTLIEGKKYRIFVEGLGTAGRRRQHTEVFYGDEVSARKRHSELVELRNSSPEMATNRWPKVALTPNAYAALLYLADQVKQSPERFLMDIIFAMVEDNVSEVR